MTIIIAEDENITRKQITKTISTLPEVDEVIEASDGIEAMELIQNRDFDVLLTDICMPGYTGLELTRYIRSKTMDKEIIIMSGYNDFEYARTALKYNVVDYITKPIDPDELKDNIKKVYVNIRKKNYKETNIRNPFFNKLVSGTETSTSKLLEEMTVLNIPVDLNLYAIAILGFKGKCTLTYNEMMKLLNENLASMEEEGVYSYPFALQGEAPAIIFGFRNYTAPKAEEVIERIAYKLHRDERSESAPPYLIAVHPFSGILKFPEEKERMLLLKNIELDFVTPLVMEKLNEEIRSEEVLSAKLEDNCRKLGTLTSRDDESINEFIDDTMRLIRELNLKDNILGEKEKTRFKLKFSAMVELEDNEELKSNIQKDMKALFDTTDLYTTRHIILEIIRKVRQHKKDSNVPISKIICDTIKNTIEQNISNENFMIQDAIEGLNYSENYLRYIFSNTEGISIKECIIRTRMEKAKQYIADGLMIKDIAELTGYNNQRYFARCFKEYTGMTPTEWRTSQQ